MAGIRSRNTLDKNYLWGLDISGTLTEAGGVGGLLAVITSNPTTMFHPSFDGNGNITAWTQSGASAPVCLREYDGFGNVVVEQGTAPSSFGFSTKLEDPETGLLYYGHRYYCPPLGRWLSPDPIEEQGGLNLYGFVGNDGIGSVDKLGMEFVPWKPLRVRALASGAGNTPTLGVVHHRGYLWVKCECNDSTKQWYPVLRRFLVQAQAILSTHVYRDKVYHALTEASTLATLAHENVHLRNIEKWHDDNLPIANEEFSDRHIFDSKPACSTYVDSRSSRWITSYYKMAMAEVGHKNGPYGGGSGALVSGKDFAYFHEVPDPHVPIMDNTLRFRNFTR